MPATHLHVTRWVDPAVETKGYAYGGGSAAIVWLPLLGPSAMVVLTRFKMHLDVIPDGYSVDLDLLSQLLGLGRIEGKHAPLLRAISRLVRFNLARRVAPGHLAVRCVIGAPSPRQLRTLGQPMETFLGELVKSRAGTAGDPGLPASGPSPTADPRDGSDT
jgi:hypothetical protein